MTLERLFKDNPQFHESSNGQPANWSVSPEVLKFMYDNLEPRMVTLEMGAGCTTVVFAIVGTNHTCITPSKRESEQIRRYCSDIGINQEITFLNQSSDVALTHTQSIPRHLDFVFIDGAHRFPFPCIDFHYTESRLKVGGILGVDDIPMPSVRILYDFLCGEDEWDLIKRIGNTAFFRRVSETRVISDWQGQKLNRPVLSKYLYPKNRAYRPLHHIIMENLLRPLRFGYRALKKAFGVKP